jgi:outer membrane protein assembly factor BamA
LEEGNWWMRVPGDAPEIFSPGEAESSVVRLERYMFSKGFFNSEAFYTADTLSKKRINLEYHVIERRPYQVKRVKYVSQDSAVMEIIASTVQNSVIEEGENYDETRIDAERARLTTSLKSEGYYDFSINDIILEVDSTVGDHQTFINVVIDTPDAGGQHIKYTIEDVKIETGAGFFNAAPPDTLNMGGMTLIQRGRHYNENILSRKIHLDTGQLYDVRAVDRTRRALSGTQMFKFVNVNFQKTDSAKLSTVIQTSNMAKYTYSAEAGATLIQNLPGPSFSLSLINRNALGLMDVYNLNFRILYEGQTTVQDTAALAREISINTGFTFPFLLAPRGKKLQEKWSYLLPTTQTTLAYNDIDRLQYQRSNINALLKYQFRMPSGRVYGFAPFDITVAQTGRIDADYLQRLRELERDGNTLINSFRNSLVTSTHFDMLKASAAYGHIQSNYNYVHLYTELGLPYLSPFEFESDTTTNGPGQFRGLEYFKFAKASLDYRNGWALGNKRQFATRALVGLATPYGGEPDGLPYEKYFFSGGSASNRGFRPRRVGPGSFTSVAVDENGDPMEEYGVLLIDRVLERPGEIIMEFNVEYRAPLFSFFNWATFIDISNVWTWDDDYNDSVYDGANTGEGSKFELNDFYKEFAISTGLGLRLDFTFIIVRLDLGIKMFDPAQPLGERFVLDNAFQDPLGGSLMGSESDFMRINLGIGYPF